MALGCESMGHPLIFFGKISVYFWGIVAAVLLHCSWDWCDDSGFSLNWISFSRKKKIVWQNLVIQNCYNLGAFINSSVALVQQKVYWWLAVSSSVFLWISRFMKNVVT